MKLKQHLQRRKQELASATFIQVSIT
ncbi:hypothetical protein CEXT_741721, partial [Caerostris extrusa]